MTIKELKEQGLILLECISGSRAYGLDTPTSDTDIKGVFYLPKEHFYGLSYISQVSNESNDEVYYEIGKFIEFLAKNNPNIIELLNTPQDCILYKHPIMDMVKASQFLSKLCEQTFGRYAISQIKKSRGLNKKILNPVDKKRKSVLDFCHVPFGQGAVPVMDYLKKQGLDMSHCGLAKIPNMREVYGVYYDPSGKYKGIIQKEGANDVALSSIPKGEGPITHMTFNKSGYSTYCKEYKAYWDWVNSRNEVRYQNTRSHGKHYDAKNMMHTFRLLNMAYEIGAFGEVNVRRKDRNFLLSIKHGEFAYDTLVGQANTIIEKLEGVYQQSKLIDTPGLQDANQLLVKLRTELYG